MTETPETFRGEDPQIWLNKFRAQAEQLQKQAEAAEERLANNQVSVQNKLMKLSLGSGGAVQSLEFLTDAGRASATELTAAFKDLYTKAGAQVARETMAVMASLAGEDDPSVQLIRRQVPLDVQLELDAEDEATGRNA